MGVHCRRIDSITPVRKADLLQNLDDFKSSSCWTPFAYGYLILMLVVSLSIYAVDTFTAINLLAFDRWAGQIKPVIPFTVSRWIFAGCIILSFVLLGYRWLRAIRVMRQGGVAKSYLDPLAVRIQCVRWGKEGRGWKRFLVFAELTKSRKGADYVALFAYFSFEAWLRIVFAEGPRQVVNAITLYSVMKLNLLPQGEHAAKDGHSSVVQFFVNVGVLADSDRLQAVILFGMLWTLAIWVISVISLMISVVLYLLFLWHHIPAEDGSLTGYCRSKINRRMERIVKTKVDKALRKENELRARQEAHAVRDGLSVKKQPTLPNIGADDDSRLPLSRQTTLTTLPEYSLAPPTSQGSSDNLPLAGMGPESNSRPPPQRTITHGSDASWSSYSSNVPLMAAAGDMGYAPPPRTQTSASATAGPWFGRPIVNTSMTNLSQSSQRSNSPGPGRPGTAQGGRNTPGAYPMEPISRPGTATLRPSYADTDGPAPYPEDRDSNGYRPPTASSIRGPSWSERGHDGPLEMKGRRTPAAAVGPSFPRISEESGRDSPMPQYQQRSQTPVAAVGPTLPRIPLDSGRNSPAPQYQQRSQTPAAAVGPTLPRIPLDSGRNSPAPQYQQRSQTSAAAGPTLPRIPLDSGRNSPAPQYQQRSHTPVRGPSERSYTPVGAPSIRTATPSGPPSLPRIQTSGSLNGIGYIPFTEEPRSMTPLSGGPPDYPFRSVSQPVRTYGSPPVRPNVRNASGGYPTGAPPRPRQGSTFDDILDHY